ncbi:MAG: alpha/beta hydrolase [Candidatus Omnitrophota bacterium]
MSKPIFKYLDRGQQKTMVLIPGWATDYRIFDSLNLKFNYLLPLDFSPFTFENSILNTLQERGIEKISLLGWSLGGFLAVEFATKYPDLIEELILVSIRIKYQQEEIAEIKELLKKSRRGYLYKFYGQCFSRQESLSWFKKNLLKTYCEKFDLEYLLKTLDFLEKAQINTQELSGIERIKIIHGEKDRIAPIDEAREVQQAIPNAELITIKDSGHIPFLEADLGRYL